MSAYDPIRDVTNLSSPGGNGKKKIHYFAHIDVVCAWLFEYLLTELALEAIRERGRPGFRSCPMRGARSASLGEDCEGCSVVSKLCGENRCERQKSQHRGACRSTGRKKWVIVMKAQARVFEMATGVTDVSFPLARERRWVCEIIDEKAAV